jgi:alpha-L-rhamnosidase
MTSFNHYALGSVADWMQRTIGGLTPAEAGYRLIQIRPHPGRGLTHAQVRHITPYGPVESSWRIENGKFYLVASVPPNTTALVTLPHGRQSRSGSGVWKWQVDYEDPDEV